jgi:hypothetical protein
LLNHFSAYREKAFRGVGSICEHLPLECQAVIDSLVCVSALHCSVSYRAAVLLHRRRGDPEAPITHHSRTMSSQEGTKHKVTKSFVLSSQEWSCSTLLYAHLSLQTVPATPRLLGGFISNHRPLYAHPQKRPVFNS